jgi:hypothetical protein
MAWDKDGNLVDLNIVLKMDGFVLPQVVISTKLPRNSLAWNTSDGNRWSAKYKPF